MRSWRREIQDKGTALHYADQSVAKDCSFLGCSQFWALERDIDEIVMKNGPANGGTASN